MFLSSLIAPESQRKKLNGKSSFSDFQFLALIKPPSRLAAPRMVIQVSFNIYNDSITEKRPLRKRRSAEDPLKVYSSAAYKTNFRRNCVVQRISSPQKNESAV